MKKLLGLLSVLTISGTAVPTTIAASPYQKEETKLGNSEINLQEDNLEDLIRVKRNKISDESCRNKITLGAGVAGGAATGAGTGAAAGAAIGSVVPGLGTAVGAAVGAVIGFFTGAGVGGGVGFSEAPEACAKEINEFVLNTDLKIIDNNKENTILTQVKKLNQSLNIDDLHVIDKNDTSAKIVASSASIYKTESYVIIKFINKRLLDWTPNLLKNWSDNYNKWVNEFNRQKKEDVPFFSIEQKRTWKDDKNFQIRTQFHSLLQNIVIIQNNNYIKELYERIVSLENDLNKLKIKVDELSSAGSLSLCGTSAGVISASSSVVPVVGNIVSYISGLISASCSLANDLN